MVFFNSPLGGGGGREVSGDQIKLVETFILVETFKKSLDKHGYAGAIVTDLSKSFDTIHHDLLIAKLHAYGFERSALRLIYSYLHNRWHRTKINSSYFRTFK